MKYKKTKRAFVSVTRKWFNPFFMEMREYEDYPFLKNSFLKHFSTVQEMRYAFKIREDEYRELYKIRGKRTRKGLPNPWDDYRSSVCDLKKSWKHNSKREKQWYK